MRRVILLALLTGCGPADLAIDQIESNLGSAERRARCEVIRDIARDRGLTNGVLLGGIGDAETGLAHCWSEATWACQGPDSNSCGGPVIAGAGDGPCADQQGGLGMFQFDAGTYDQTIARDGADILLLEGNISHAVDFVIGMVRRSEHTPNFDNDQQALDWMNQIPIELGNPDYEAWVSTVTHYYNGCAPTYSCWDQRRGRYDSLTRGVYDEMGPDFWMAPPPAPCEQIPPEGRTIEETDPCYEDSGPLETWRVADAGHDGRLAWTYAWESDTPGNYAVWKLDLAVEGTYRIEVYTDAAFAHSKETRYLVDHASTTDAVPLDQTAVDGWQSLGDFFFAAGGDQYVRLDDNTGEALSAQVQIAYDALRLTPVTPEVPEPKEILPVASDWTGPSNQLIAQIEEPQVNPEKKDEGGCVCVRGERGSLLYLLAALAIVVASRRRFGRTTIERSSAS